MLGGSPQTFHRQQSESLVHHGRGNCVPRSVNTSLRITTGQNIPTMASVSVIGSAFSSGTASGHRVLKSAHVSRYFDPSVAQRVMGPTTSTATLSNGSVMRGNGCKCIYFTRFQSVVFWHILHDSTYQAISAFIPVQKNLWQIRLRGFCGPI